MALKVTNLSRNLILVRPLSGGTVHLRPGEQSDELPDAEVKGNPRVEDLVGRRLLGVEEIPDRRKTRRSSATAETKSAATSPDKSEAKSDAASEGSA
jgi:hypothetical protein